MPSIYPQETHSPSNKSLQAPTNKSSTNKNPQSSFSSQSPTKTKLINDEFKCKYRIDEELVYDFNSNKYSSTSRVQDLIRKYNNKISSSSKNYSSATKYSSGYSKDAFSNSKEGHSYIKDVYSGDYSGNRTNDGRTMSFYDTPVQQQSFYNAPTQLQSSHVTTHSSFSNSQLTKSPINNHFTTSSINNSHLNNTQHSTPSLSTAPLNNTQHSTPSLSTAPLNNSHVITSPVKKSQLNKNLLPNLNPINVIYTPRKIISQEQVQKQEPVQLKTSQVHLYGPSVELTFPIKFNILNTIYDFDENSENTIYYLQVTSNISWILVKTLKQIKEFLKGHDLSYNYCPIDKQIRDDIIVSILNNIYKDISSYNSSSIVDCSGTSSSNVSDVNISGLNISKVNTSKVNGHGLDISITNGQSSTGTKQYYNESNSPYNNNSYTNSPYKHENNIKPTEDYKSSSITKYSLDDLQYFILTNITKEIKYKGQYLLIDTKPYLCKLIGKALVSYNLDNRVYKLFLLDECKIEMDLNKSCSFVLINRKSVYELTASCRKERDEWIREIREFMIKR